MIDPSPNPDDAPQHILGALDAAYAPTPLVDLPEVAARIGVAQVLAKDEGRRALGSFKSLGGTYAGLKALARAAGVAVPDLVATRPPSQPALVCASDGNHGLAVASAARLAGAPARIFLHEGVSQARAARICDEGAEIVWVSGTYDDAVNAAALAVRRGAGILLADTSGDADDPVVRDVMAGYRVMAGEIRDAVEAVGSRRPTHLFVQAGVGGLAAALAPDLAEWMDAPGVVVAVEPETSACLGSALAAGRPVRISGDLLTSAEMLSCGEASAPALVLLRHHRARCVTVSEAALIDAPRMLAAHGGPATTPSGAAGLAGLVAAVADRMLAIDLELDASSRILVLVTERALEA